MASSREHLKLGPVVAEMQDEALAQRRRPAASERLSDLHGELGRRAQARTRTRVVRRVGAGIALASIAAVALAVVLLRPRSESLAFTFGDPAHAGEIDVWMAAPPLGQLPIGFSDGTRLELDDDARARVIAVTSHGARVVVERGAVHVNVVPRAGNDWSVIGGPFEIHVTGTRFDARWDPGREVLDVTMHEGKVVVRAACLAHDRALVQGESASLTCAPRVTSIEPSASPEAPEAPRIEVPAVSEEEAPPPTSLPSLANGDARRDIAAAPSWRELTRRGAYKEALAKAEAEGFDALTERLSATELVELGDAARFASKPARAKQAYASVRRRFAGGDPAAMAAFHLGGIAFDGSGAYAEARVWFSTYLAERPLGPLGAEALGRVMECEQHAGDLASARATASRYLDRYPKGAHAALAKSLRDP